MRWVGIPKPSTVQEYLDALPRDMHTLLQHVREIILSVVPEATEHISYGIILFKHLWRRLMYIGAAKDHCALYGATGALVAQFADELAWFSISKWTIRFTSEHPLPDMLIKKIVKAAVVESEKKAQSKKTP